MATIWLTYAWVDNAQGDVDFIAQELERKGLTVKLDRWTLGTGQRLWDQIDRFITDPAESDAWVMLATQGSLGSQPCREEYAYALDRALRERDGGFAVAAIFQSAVDATILPAGLKTRLCVSLADPDWAERIAAAAEGRPHVASRTPIEPFQLTVHPLPEGKARIEVRPRAGSWVPFTVGVPAREKERIGLQFQRAAAGREPPNMFAQWGVREGPSPDGLWALYESQEEATPTLSFHIHCQQLPSVLLFGRTGDLFRMEILPGQNVTVRRLT